MPPLNFGDELSPVVVGRILNAPIVWSNIRHAEMVGIGSVLQRIHPGSQSCVVFGSGLRSGEPIQLPDSVRVVSVRGRLTAAALGLPSDTLMGDPGLLAPHLIGLRPAIRRSGVVLIPHFTDMDTRAGRARLHEARAWGAEIVLPSGSPEEVVAKIGHADLVLSSSLHGLVVADALGIPALRIKIPESPRESDFKFRDYASVFNVSSASTPIADVLLNGPYPSTVSQLEERTSSVAARLPEVLSEIEEAAIQLRNHFS